MKDGFVQFNYRGWHKELLQRIALADVVWASELLGELSDRQWSDAFRAGGYPPALAARFITRLHQKIAEGRRLGEAMTSDLAAFPGSGLPLAGPLKPDPAWPAR
jgi:hypothetical protein